MDFEYRIENNEALITRCGIFDKNTVEVPEQIGEYPVVGLDERSFSCITTIKKIVLPKTIKIIGDKTFYWCSALEELEIQSCEHIGKNCFSKTKLKNIHIPHNTSCIDVSAFLDIPTLQNITVDDYNEFFSTEDGVLYNKDKSVLRFCPQGKTNCITVNTNCVSISSYAFYNSSVKQVNFNNKLEMIFTEAFRGCAMETMMLPPHLTYIGDGAFYGAENITDIFIPSSVTEIGKEAFKFCVNAETVYIGTGVSELKQRTFEKCFKLKTVNMQTVEKIGSYCFNDCFRMTDIDLSNVKSIGYSAFLRNESLLEVDLSMCDTVLARAFKRCYNLKSVVLCKKLYEIRSEVFSACFELENINAEKVMSVGKQSFYGVDSDKLNFGNDTYFEQIYKNKSKVS